MAAPIGHGIVGMLVARRMGVRSPAGLFTAFLAANIPDLDIPASWILQARCPPRADAYR